MRLAEPAAMFKSNIILLNIIIFARVQSRVS